MKFIAHRGLTNGPDKSLENNPNIINLALDQGFDCEIDVWVHDNTWYLGHDNPQYQIDIHFLNKPGLWIHAKNLDALQSLTSTNLNYFWHQEDDYTITSHGFIWSYPGKPLSKKSICLMPEWNNPEFKNLNFECYGICSDFVNIIKKRKNNYDIS
jgi:hypothetical protein